MKNGKEGRQTERIKAKEDIKTIQEDRKKGRTKRKE